MEEIFGSCCAALIVQFLHQISSSVHKNKAEEKVMAFSNMHLELAGLSRWLCWRVGFLSKMMWRETGWTKMSQLYWFLCTTYEIVWITFLMRQAVLSWNSISTPTHWMQEICLWSLRAAFSRLKPTTVHSINQKVVLCYSSALPRCLERGWAERNSRK